MLNLDFSKIGDIATLIKAGISLSEIKQLAEVIETSPELPENPTIEDVKEAAEKDSFELPQEPEDKLKEDPISVLRNLVDNKEE